MAVENVQTAAEGPRASLQRSIVIALGGTGAEVIMRTRTLLAERFGSLDKMPIIRFLYLDTDPGWVRKVTQDVDTDVRLTPAEVVDLQVPDAAGLYSGIRAGNYPEFSWFSLEKLSGLESITEGAGTIRQLGRLAFWQHFNTFREKLKATVLDLVKEKHADEVRRLYGTDVETGVAVYVVAGLAGGTGSGTFLDVAYAVRKLLASLSVHGACPITGFLVMPQAFQEVAGETGLANGYAALKELNYYNYLYSPNHLLASLYGVPKWQVRYPHTNEGEVEFAQTAPFDFCYLMDSGNGEVELDRNHVFAMIAQSLFNEYSLEFARHKRALRANIINQVNQNDVLDCPARFLSYGQSSISFPVYSIRRVLQYEVARRALEYLARAPHQEGQHDWRSGSAAALSVEEIAGSSQVRDFVRSLVIDNFLLGKGLRKSDLIGGILQVRKMRLSDVPYQLVNTEQQRWISQNWKKEVFVNRVTASWDHWRRDFSDEGDEAAWGERIRVLATNRDRLKRELEEQIAQQANSLMDDQARGPAYALAFVRMLKAPIKQLEAALLEDANSARVIAQELGDVYLIAAADSGKWPSLSVLIADRIGTELNELERLTRSIVLLGGIERVRRQAEEYLKWCAHWCRAKVEERARRLGSAICADLYAFLDQKEAEIRDKALLLGKLHSNMRRLRDEWYDKAAATETVGELLVNDMLLGVLDQKLREQHADQYTPQTVARRALAILGRRLGELTLDSEGALRSAMLQAAGEAIGDLSEQNLGDTHFAAYDLLVALHPEQDRLRALVDDTIKKCEPFVRLLPNPPGGQWSPKGTFPQGPVTARAAGMRGGSQAADRERQRLLDALEACGWSSEDVQAISDSSQIIFVRECGGFPLRAINGLEVMKRHYELRRKIPQNPPLHIVRDEMADAFPEPYAPSKEETTRAIELFVAGQALGVILEKDFPHPSGEGQLRLWSYTKRLENIDESRPEPIAGSESAVIMRLALDKGLAEDVERAVSHAIRRGGQEKCEELRQFVRSRLEALREKLKSEGIEPETNLRYQMEQDACEQLIRRRCQVQTG